MTEQNTATTEEVVNPLARELELTVSVADAQALTEKSLRRYAKNAKMPGFRKGHVPMDRVRGMYGAQAYEEAINELIGQAWFKAAQESGLKIVGMPSIDAKESDDQENMHFVAQFEVFPEIEVPDFSEVELVRYTCPVTDAEVNKTLDVMSRQRAQYTVVDRAAQNDDRVQVNFEGTKDGVPFEGGASNGYTFVLGQGRMLAEFETAVLGMKAGEEKTFDLTFPENYGVEELNGQTVQFKVQVTQVEEPQYPEIDDEFAKSLGIVDGVETMRREIKANLEREVKARLEVKMKAETLEAANKVATFPVPQALVRNDAQALANQMARDFVNRGLDPKQLPEIPVESFLEQAERRVRLGLLMDAMTRTLDVAATDEQIRALAGDIAASYEQPEEVIDFMMKDSNRLDNMRAQVTEANVCHWILDHAKTREEQVDFDKLMAGDF